MKKKFVFFLIFYTSTLFSLQDIFLAQFLQMNNNVHILCLKDRDVFDNKQYPIFQDEDGKRFPFKGEFCSSFIIEILDGQLSFYPSCYSSIGYPCINNCFIKELQIKDLNPHDIGFESANLYKPLLKNMGKVAVLWHLYPDCYGHWVFDILGQLAFLEKNNITYHYVCVPYYNKYMVESLDIWGIERSKIIPQSKNLVLQGDIILPSPVTQIETYVSNANYNRSTIIQYIRAKMIAGSQDEIERDRFGHKIFISRKDAPFHKRGVTNEDDIFALFEQKGFKRYELSSLSMKEQVALFYNAESVVSFVGSGSTNIMYCKPETRYLEICYNMVDATFFFLADTCNLDYKYINCSCEQNIKGALPWTSSVVLSTKPFEKFLEDETV